MSRRRGARRGARGGAEHFRTRARRCPKRREQSGGAGRLSTHAFPRSSVSLEPPVLELPVRTVRTRTVLRPRSDFAIRSLRFADVAGSFIYGSAPPGRGNLSMPTLAENAVKNCLRIRPDDNVTIFFYPHTLSLAEDLATECFKVGADVLLNLYTDKYYSAYMKHLSTEKLRQPRSEEHTSELQSHSDLVCRLLLEKKKRRRTSQNSRITYETI